MSEARKGKKQNPLQGRLEAQLKSKSASLPTPLDYGGAGNAVKGRDERQLRAPLTAFPAPVPPSVLTTAVVVIHGMTTVMGLKLSYLLVCSVQERSQCLHSVTSPNPSWFHHRSSIFWSRPRIPARVTPAGGGRKTARRS